MVSPKGGRRKKPRVREDRTYNPIKITCLGHGAAGKTKAILRMVFPDYPWNGEYDPTIEDVYRVQVAPSRSQSKFTKVPPQSVNILDTAGQEEFTALLASQVKGSEGVILFYSPFYEKALEQLDRFAKIVIAERENSRTRIPILIVATQEDRYQTPLLSWEHAEDYYQFHEMKASRDTEVKEVQGLHLVSRSRAEELLLEQVIDADTKVAQQEALPSTTSSSATAAAATTTTTTTPPKFTGYLAKPILAPLPSSVVSELETRFQAGTGRLNRTLPTPLVIICLEYIHYPVVDRMPISWAAAKRFADSLDAPLMSVSAWTKRGVHEVFWRMVTMVEEMEWVQPPQPAYLNVRPSPLFNASTSKPGKCILM